MTTTVSNLPSGPLRLATTSASKPAHTFTLRYPASHPADLSTAGASLSSTASGDVSLRMAPGSQPGEVRGRRWAGRQTRVTGDVECAIVWDGAQNCWMLHRVDNIVQLASDDPDPIPRKPTPSIPPPIKSTPLALPKPARPIPVPTPVAPVTTLTDSQPIKVETNLKTLNGSIINQSSKPTIHESSTSTSRRQDSIESTASKTDLALPIKKSITPQLMVQRTTGISSPGEQGPIRVVQAEEIEEFDFVDSPPDPIPNQPIIIPSPLTLPSPASTNRINHENNQRSNSNQGLELPSRPTNRLSNSNLTSATYVGLRSTNQPTAPSPLQSVAYSSSSSGSSPNDHPLPAPTPMIITPANLNAPTTSRIIPTRSPAPVWHNHHLQHPSNPNSPHHQPSNTNINTNATVPTRTYVRSDSGSSVRESDSDSEDSSSEEEEEEEEEEGVEEIQTEMSTVTNVNERVTEETNSEEDAEADSDSEDEEELQNFATELEASMLLTDYYGPGTAAYKDKQDQQKQQQQQQNKEKNVSSTATTTTTTTTTTKKKGGGGGGKSGKGGKGKK